MVSRKEWNALAHVFERETCDITRETGGDRIVRLMRSVRFSKSAVLVDLGCGIGTFVERYGARFARTYAVEHAPRIIARGKKRLAGRDDITWITSNIPPAVRRIGRKADLAVCMNVITMPQARIRESMWRALAQVTKKRGRALIVVPSSESDRMVDRIAYDTTLAEWKAEAPNGLVERDGSRQKHFARDELEELLARHGFRIRKMQRVFYPWKIEGLRKPRAAGTRMPWDWLVLAERR